MTAKCPLKAEARRLGRKRYSGSVPCAKGHGTERLTSTGGCVECARELRRKHRRLHPVKERSSLIRTQLRRKYGLSADQYLLILQRQGFRCAVCYAPIKSRLDESRPLQKGASPPSKHMAFVDHCHKTGVVRGALCSNCNFVLGHARDDESILLRAVRYLRESATAQGSSRTDHDTIEAAGEPEYRDLDRSVQLEALRSVS